MHIFIPPYLSEIFLHFLNLSKLSLSNCYPVNNISCLCNLSSLAVSYCPGISSVEGLGKVSNLFIKGCPAITDISPLTSNTKLTILKCSKIDIDTFNFQTVRYFETDLIVDYEQMKTVSFDSCYSLTLTQYNDTPVFTEYKNLRSLSIRYVILGSFPECIQQRPLDNFIHLFRVCLTGRFNTVFDLSPVYSVPVVILKDLSDIQTLKGLGGNRRLNFIMVAGLMILVPSEMFLAWSFHQFLV
jgi:hypothetical protein